MRQRIAMFLMLACLLPASIVRADSVVLKTGERYEGTLANRGAARRDLRSQTHVSLLLAGSSELLRFDTADVDYVIFEDDGKKEVVDLASLGVRLVPAISQASSESGPIDGAPLIIGGIVLGGVGAFVKFGEEKVTITESSVDYAEKSYNVTNYVMMAAGGGMVIAGIAISASSQASGSDHAELLTFEPCTTPLSRVPAIAFRFRF